jgi:D-3-phosphoglycerate dehydrogenase / 2-oxoglutarate reductase
MESKKYKVLISDNLAIEGVEVLQNSPNIQVDVKTKHTPEELIKLIPEYHGIIVRSATKLTAEVIEAAKNLKVIARAGTGYDNIDIKACSKQGILVLITPLGNSNAVVELTLGLMLTWARNIARANQSMIEGKWEKKKFGGQELKGKTVGIIGLGRIGAGVSKRCKAFDMNVIAFDKYLPKIRAEELGVELIDDINKFVSRADYITLHIPLTESTKDLIAKEQFDLMKKNSVVVNVARGGVVNEKDLYDALVNEKIAGACMDVFSKEPANKEEFPFIGLDNVISTPHLGASTSEAQIDVAKLAAEHLVQALNSNLFIDAVNVPFNISEDLAELYKPYMELGSDLAKILTQSTKEPIISVDIEYKGDVFTTFEPIKAIIIYSIFENRFADTLTFMNLKTIIEENGIKVNAAKSTKKMNLENQIKIIITKEDGTKSKIVGTVFSLNPKIIEIDDNYMDISPSEFMLMLDSYDRPGVIGRVGTFLSEKGVNIAGWQLGRQNQGGKALSMISLDDPLTIDVLKELKEMSDIIEAKFIHL